MDIITHPFPPVYDADSRVLILGSLPSVRSRQEGFYYGHARNRFWPLLAALFAEPVPTDTQGKRALLLAHGVALWDVVARCRITASADASIRDAEPNDVAALLAACPIRAIFTNGAAAGRLYARLLRPQTGREALTLPSTSPANAAWSFERLLTAWRPLLAALSD